MKTILVMLFAIGLTLAGNAQEKMSRTLESMDVIPAQFTGTRYIENTDQGADLLMQFLRSSISEDNRLTEVNFEGTEVVKFTVTETGNVKDIKFVNGICNEIDDAVARALYSTSGMWKPALKGGNDSECYKVVSLSFSHQPDNLATEEYFSKQAKKYFVKACEHMFIDQKLKKAERDLNAALNYMPYDGSTLYLRGICRYERGNTEGAIDDWSRFTEITGLTAAPPELVLDEKQFKGVEAFASLYKK
ncbi:hypothetical protein [Maribellus sediminis]|uniref:hypothetical protein n=1 Tax=Maribellus sediminis TaxID=2696285 RepID=UPI0014310A87|nr:hypothetical protein [Maribellus sediminis]